MSYNIIDDAPNVTEPISLAEQKAYSRIDADYSSEDNDLAGLISGARSLIEGWLNVGLANRDVKVEWSGCEIKLPLSPNGNILSVMNGEVLVPADEYTVSSWQNKSIYVNSFGYIGVSWWYSRDMSYVIPERLTEEYNESVYVVKYNTGYTSELLPKALKQAIMAQVDWMYKNRGEPNASSVCPQAVLLASSYSRNLVL